MRSTNYRKDRIIQYLKDHTEEALQRNGSRAIGLSATDIAQALSLDRTCVSRDLNALYRDGLALKLLGKPTLYLYHSAVADYFDNQRLPNTIPLGGNLSDHIAKDRPLVPAVSSTPPQSFLYDRSTPSLSHAAMQAEAAINYPGSGLHTLIYGQHGTGKRVFLEKMFSYGKEVGKFAPNAKLYSFDCQSAINSSPSSLQQALAIQFFGCGAGLFSPNSPSRKGLVEQAADSVLLLENPQLLPASIQEKFISLMTFNEYSRLGEGTVTRQARAMIVAICSELPLPIQRCPLLQHFPVHIMLPAYSDRTPAETFSAVSQYFQAEARALNCDLHVSKEVFFYLMCDSTASESISPRGYIKSICAMAYREQALSSRYYFLDIKHQHLPPSILSRKPTPEAIARYTAFLDQHFGDEILIRQDGASPLPSAPPVAEPTATFSEPILSDSALHPVEHYLEKCLCAAFEANGSVPPSLENQTACVWQHLRHDPALGKLTPEDPMIQGLLSLFPLTGAKHTPPFSPPQHQASLAFLQPPSLPALDSVKELEMQLRPYLNQELSAYQRSFVAWYLHLIQQRADAGTPLLFIAFHGEGVSAGMAKYLNELFHCSLIPLSFSQADTLERIFLQIDQAIAENPSVKQALFFSDGLPLNSLHSYVESTYDLQAKTICKASYETIHQTITKLVLFHYTLDMLEIPADAAKSESALRSASVTHLSPFVLESVQQFLVPSLSFLDINTSLPLAEEALREIGTQLQISISDEVAIKYHFHCAHMLERLIRKEPFDYPQLKTFINQHHRTVRIINGALQPLAQHYGLRIPSCEIAYLAEIFLPM